ncbi:hypothetical protein Pmani_025710 [Petrolisthes manimaculis]|uniref:FAM86 N-terminal domain-containing protein n=1 Tax=Petrolisthes manimaculis TaxID=1843537 RepID=A0AAE1P693_9EUCA|nr:hypothetical protein Pmani_025710 [Petrolisthes manimaculis]
MLQDIENLSWQYLRMYPLKDICWKNVELLLVTKANSDSLDIQRDILRQTVHHFLALKFPPTESYTRLFLKSLISKIEECNQEVLEDMYTAYTDLLSQPSVDPGGFCYRTYKMTEGCVVSLKETCNLICNGTTGMCTWKASHVLGPWCARESQLFHKKNILELGAGLGLTGITVVRTCHPASYTLTDLHETVLKTLRENVVLNLGNENHDRIHDVSTPSSVSEYEGKGIAVQIRYKDTDVQVMKLNWEEGICNMEPDVILGADVVYDNEVTLPLVKLLKVITTKRPKVDIFLACTLRNPSTYAYFKELLASHALHISSELLHQYQESPSQPQNRITIVHIVSPYR